MRNRKCCPIALTRQRAHIARMDKRATKRPAGFAKPAHWSNEPAPVPQSAQEDERDPEGLSPTRYGDWVRKGIAVDF
jgi:hypothetical protein